ncbi:NagC family transcriptional regulator [Bifidobacterium goeldii]|uniref:NagC family transcriptional regulator n=1 Tax=Bifidobacterium goeldii TaxID=2306975 RepID=A0A430FK91_9BIFI|nr:ROK family protein [Bifidobacterium goeldii]RSX53309.1 NagC family transcriptional regulator [Bifidobacterium goeldii]
MASHTTSHNPDELTAGHCGLRIGIDIGGTKIEAVLVAPDGTIVATDRIPARRGNDQVVEDVVSIARSVAGEHFESVLSVGIGIPGQVDCATGRIAHVVNLDIDTLELGALAGKQLGLPVHVENDVNAAAVGAAHVLAGTDMSGTIVFLNFGTGLAAGIVDNGTLLHGYSGAIGEIGHVPVDPNQFECPCGQRGCLETVCSGASVGRLWPKANPPMPGLITAAHLGDMEAQRVLAMVTHAIVDTVQMVAQAYDPKLIIFGGGMAKTGQPLIDVTLEELARREAHCPFLKGLHLADRLRLAPAAEPLGALGAAWAAASI